MDPSCAEGAVPELPEVEHAARSMQAWLAGERITAAEGTCTRVFRGSSAQAFARALRGRALEGVERRGKYLLLTFDGGVGLLSHLGMTGRWLRRAPGDPSPRHSRARLRLASGAVLHYDDPRMFGRLRVVPAADLLALPELRGIGPDPLRDGVDAEALGQALRRTSRAVKVALMDPAVIAGVGNIQATEALFRAGVHPARPARSLKPVEVARIAAGIHASIAHALAGLAAKADVEYLSDGSGTDNPFLIYDRAGEACPRCAAVLDKVPLGGRTSAYCPCCQPRRATSRRPPGWTL